MSVAWNSISRRSIAPAFRTPRREVQPGRPSDQGRELESDTAAPLGRDASKVRVHNTTAEIPKWQGYTDLQHGAGWQAREPIPHVLCRLGGLLTGSSYACAHQPSQTPQVRS